MDVATKKVRQPEASSGSFASSPPPTRQDTRAVAGWRTQVLVLACLLFVASSWLAIEQKPGPGGLVGSSAWTWRFWRDPIEFNALKRLQSIDADLRSVFALQDGTGTHVW